MHNQRIKPALISVMMFTGFLLTGCGDSSDTETNLKVELITTPTPTADLHQAIQLELQGIDSFQVELLDPQDRPLQFGRIQAPPKGETAELQFNTAEDGSYLIRSSAFTADNAILGTTRKTVQLDAGLNYAAIDTLGLSELYYANNNHLPQTQSPAQLEQYLSYDQPGITLQAYCFFGYLEDEQGERMAYFSLLQRADTAIDNSGLRLPMIMSGTGVSTRSLGGFLLGGTAGPALVGNTISLTQPWDLSVSSDNGAGSLVPENTTRARLVSGVFGQQGAQYELSSNGVDNFGNPFTTEILVTDTMGFVSEGFGQTSFLPNWLLPEQEAAIRQDFGGSVEKYLATTQNPLTGQGSHYYSAPFLEVVSYKVSYDKDGSVLSQGSGGLLWMDVVYQSFDDAAANIVADATWSFFIMQFPEQKKALMTTLVGTKVSDYRISSLFSMDAPKNANGVLEPEYRWNLQDIDMQPVPGSEWQSPNSGKTYYTQYKILLAGEHSADLTVTMEWNDQEVNVGGRYVYEGLGKVTGMLDGEAVNGSSWLEMQPIGTLN